MRIVQIGAYPQSRNCIRGGVEASVFGLAQELSKANEVHVFDLPRIACPCKTEFDKSVCVHRTHNKGERLLSTSFQVRTMAEEIVSLNPDVCHIHGTNLFSWLMYRTLKKHNMNVMVTIHGLVRVEKLNALKKHFNIKSLAQFIYQGWAEKRLLSHLPVCIVDTDYVKEKVNGYPVCHKPIMRVVPQGINEEFFSIHCSVDGHTLMSVGTIGERKGHMITLKAYELFRRMGGEADLVIAGASSDKKYLGQLRRAIENSKYSGRIKLCTDISNEELKKLYQKAHLFVLHTQEESQGIVFAEAMAVGLPVVSTLVGGVPYVVKQGDTGLLSKYGDVDAFANNIHSLMVDDSKWHAMSEASLREAHDYHWHIIGDKVMELYQLEYCS